MLNQKAPPRRTNGDFQCPFVRELPDGQFALVVQWIRMVGDDFTMAEEIQHTGPNPQSVILPYILNDWAMPPAPWQR